MPQDNIKTLHDLLNKQYGVKVDVKVKTVTVGTTPTRVIDNNPNRVGYLVINLSSGSLFASFDTAVSTTNGILLGQLGGQFSMNWQYDFDVVGYELYGVVASGSNTVYVAEVVIVGQ